mmetsp:Transcript_32094/g.89858  ORF Transcript_32094/g.89858 Transcript_32094/m.89858 type:complete len:784 (-) Transcript_32094:879-3230(-)
MMSTSGSNPVPVMDTLLPAPLSPDAADRKLGVSPRPIKTDPTELPPPPPVSSSPGASPRPLDRHASLVETFRTPALQSGSRDEGVSPRGLQKSQSVAVVSPRKKKQARPSILPTRNLSGSVQTKSVPSIPAPLSAPNRATAPVGRRSPDPGRPAPVNSGTLPPPISPVVYAQGGGVALPPPLPVSPGTSGIPPLPPTEDVADELPPLPENEDVVHESKEDKGDTAAGATASGGSGETSSVPDNHSVQHVWKPRRSALRDSQTDSFIGTRGQNSNPSISRGKMRARTQENVSSLDSRMKKSFTSGSTSSIDWSSNSTYEIKSGWLYRKTGKRHQSSKKLWFSLEHGKMTMYSDSNCNPKGKKGEYDLNRSTCQVMLRGSAQEQSAFAIITKDAEIEVRALSVDEVAEWIAAFEEAIGPLESGGSNDLRVVMKTPSSATRSKKKAINNVLEKFDKMLDAITNLEANGAALDLLMKCTAKKDEKALADQLVHAFEIRRCTLSFLTRLINASVEYCSLPTTLFRGNAIPEKALTIYCHLVGCDYLKRCLKPLFMSVVHSDAHYEIDPTRLQEGTVESNSINLLSVSQMFIAKITASKSTNVPYAIREVCRTLAVSTGEKFPDGLHAVIGGLFFLRFVCPSLLVPQESGIWEDPLPPKAKRALLLISKMLMNLSNGVKFGKKEAYMIPMNDFVDSNEVLIRKFFDRLLTPKANQDADEQEEEEKLRQEEVERIEAVEPSVEKLAGLASAIRENGDAMKEKAEVGIEKGTLGKEVLDQIVRLLESVDLK